MKIVFFPGGTPGGGFETVVYNGAKAAQALLGPDVTYQWSDWDPSKMITQFQQAVATKPDGIAIMGHPGDDAFDPLIKDAESQGILVTAMNTELQKAEATYAASGFGYVGAVLHDAGAALANEAISRGGLKSGDRAMVWGLKAQPGRGQRTQGILDALQAAGLTVDYFEIDDATNTDPANGVPTFTGYVSAHPDVKAMFIDHGNLTSSIPTYMKAANLQPGKVYMSGFDASAATVQGIKDGYIQLVIDQQQYLQGFMAVLNLCLTKSYGFSGLFINTGGGFIDKSNVDFIAPLVAKQIR
jgi:simple sugar transport system substrate-binding protein